MTRFETTLAIARPRDAVFAYVGAAGHDQPLRLVDADAQGAARRLSAQAALAGRQPHPILTTFGSIATASRSARDLSLSDSRSKTISPQTRRRRPCRPRSFTRADYQGPWARALAARTART